MYTGSKRYLNPCQYRNCTLIKTACEAGDAKKKEENDEMFTANKRND